ncbi:MAG: NAD-dependent epimerase/dehydratase family protein [Thiofilum sp.]|uniref:NAD-dependent epimerase/dehydratase family protein n=1 Tax=Thiofilum sp. TaxID=2212733 RepID=UPI0025E98EF6|nr:NAD-dependent epimerase/dehydratase family protein [Thiofilum sp.]MBK8453988.1 NAD-dependent epimerase/dehydratase family protein [Thiofilum sp.]
MHILLTGASGFIGQALTQALQAQGHTIKPIARRYGHDFNQLTTVEAWLPLLDSIDVVINSVGIIGQTRGQSFQILHTQAPIALFKACEQLAISKIIQISALGADSEAKSAYHLSKKQADDFLRATSLNAVVLRPSLVYGEQGASTQLFKRLARLPLLGTLGKGDQIIRPVHIDDLVATVIQALTATPHPPTLDVVGRQEFTFIKWLQFLRRLQGIQSPLRTFSIPIPLALAGAHWGQYLSPLIHPDSIHMLLRGNSADVQPLTQFLGREPLDWEQLL